MKIIIIGLLLIFSSVFSIFSQFLERVKLEEKAQKAYTFCKKNSYNTNFCVLTDMSIHSGKKRLFIWQFSNDSILNSGLCSHGCGDNTWASDETKDAPIFSNVSESYCSSLGKYKIGKRGYSNFGININYKLHGLDSSNSNAYSRFIVLHSWGYVPDNELYPSGTPEGWGCPAVSDNFMMYLDSMLIKQNKPTLFWMFN